ncbi:MAG TPA: GNAT family N-acetyltransferase [Mycobacteriales bacterium]|nr:GNAT family N-acetyltransferase [Mycobacteriales bacterium]
MAAGELVGRKVVVRRVTNGPDAGPEGRRHYTDVVGILIREDPATLSVRRRNNSVVDIPRSEVQVVKQVPAAPLDVLELERVALAGWPAPQTRWLGRWLLRAAAGFTGRANSVLPLGGPDRPLDAALAEVAAWYGERGLPARVVIPTPAREALDAALAARGWTAYNPTEVLTADVGVTLARLPARADLPPVAVEDTAADDWVAAYHYRGGGELPQVGRAILAGARQPGFAVVRQGGAVLAIARASVDEGWVGVTAVEVDPGHRRRGLASHVTRELLRWAAERGATSAYLQVAADNAPALALYHRLGFARHHRYHYRIAPGGPVTPA